MVLQSTWMKFAGLVVLAFAVAMLMLTTTSANPPGNSPFAATDSTPDCPGGGLPATGGPPVTNTCNPPGDPVQSVDVTWIADEVSGSTDNAWVQGTSSDCYLAKAGGVDGACVTAGHGSIPGKNDLEQLGVGLEKSTVDGEFYFYGGINRASAGGISSSNANYNIEINQLLPAYEPLANVCEIDTDGACNRWRSPGDLVLMVDWGGANASCNVAAPAACIYEWIDTSTGGDKTPNSGTCFNSKAPPCWGNVVPLSIGGDFAAGSISENSRFSEFSVNLNDSGLISQGECLVGQQVVASSRASSSFTAEEKDKIYAAVELSTCTTTSTTLQQVDCTTDANIGTAAKELTLNLPVADSVCVKDIATVGGGATSGNVNFRYYPSLEACNADEAGTGGTEVSTNAVNASSIATSSKVTFTTAGVRYFRAFYLGNGLSPSVSACDEILTVRQNTSAVTSLHETDSGGTDVDPSNNGLTITLAPGAYVTDTVTVSPSSATGSVTFRYYSSLTACTDGGQTTEAPTGTGGTLAGTGIALSSGTASSTTVQLTTPGDYYWRAFFVGTGLFNNSQSPCDEIVTVQRVDTSIATAPWVYPNDDATISVPSGTGNLAGSVKFRLYDSFENCDAETPSDTVDTGGLLFRQVVNLTGTSISETVSTSNGDGTTSATKSADRKVESDTTVWWLVEFTSTNTAQNGSSSVCIEKIAVQLTDDPIPTP